MKLFRKKRYDLDFTFEEADRLLNKAHRIVRPGVELWELKTLLDELDKFTFESQKRWLGKRKLVPEKKMNLKILLFQINEAHETVKKYKTNVEKSVYFRAQQLEPSEVNIGRTRNLQELAYWPLRYSDKLFSKLGSVFSERGRDD